MNQSLGSAAVGGALCVFGALGFFNRAGATPAAREELWIVTPRDGALFPRDMAPPLFLWNDRSAGARWRVSVTTADGRRVTAECGTPEWRPSVEEWETIKSASVNRPARFVVTRQPGAGAGSTSSVSSEGSFQTSIDVVEAPIFYREVPLPVAFAMDNKPLIAWKLADLASLEPPRTVLSGMRTCANCHSFTSDGHTLAMDLDFGTDKGAYAIAEVGREVRIGRSELMTWNDFRREDGKETLGLLSTITPDGRSVVSTVKETIVLKFMPDPDCSQIFFPIRGVLVSYERRSRTFQPVSGASDPEFVQTNPTFSPDGNWLVFARARVPRGIPETLAVEGGASSVLLDEFADGRRKIQFDLYRVPFNGGRGGIAEPVKGATSNGKSNFFARYSPDGRWIVFCQAESMMLNRLDSLLFIVPAQGGNPRQLLCNEPGRMNSWHSFSPNGRWLVYASKAAGPLTQLWLTHIDEHGNDSPPVMLSGLVAPGRAANIPEFVKLRPGHLQKIVVADEIRRSTSSLPRSR